MCTCMSAEWPRLAEARRGCRPPCAHSGAGGACWRPNEAVSHIGARVGVGVAAAGLQLEVRRDEPHHLRRQPPHARTGLEEHVGAGLHPPQREAQEAALATRAGTRRGPRPASPLAMRAAPLALAIAGGSDRAAPLAVRPPLARMRSILAALHCNGHPPEGHVRAREARLRAIPPPWLVHCVWDVGHVEADRAVRQALVGAERLAVVDAQGTHAEADLPLGACRDCM